MNPWRDLIKCGKICKNQKTLGVYYLCGDPLSGPFISYGSAASRVLVRVVLYLGDLSSKGGLLKSAVTHFKENGTTFQYINSPKTLFYKLLKNTWQARAPTWDMPTISQVQQSLSLIKLVTGSFHDKAGT